MTMLLGINLTDRAFLSADTRATAKDGCVKDDVQKIEILPKLGLIIATAGRVGIATEIFNAISIGFITTPITAKSVLSKIDGILSNFLARETVKKIIPSSLLGPVIMLIHEYADKKIHMHAIHVKFKIGTKINSEIYEYEVRHGQYIKIGFIGEDSPIYVKDLPRNSLKYLNHNKITYYDYTLATDMIFETAKKTARIIKYDPEIWLKHNPIGGKTISIKTWIDSKKNCRYIGIPGYKSIIDEDEQYQDVSTVTMLDLSSNRFYLRDMRKEGMIISNIEYKGPGTKPVLRYDSCGTDYGRENIYYNGLSQNIATQKIDLEF
jgi:hypothetical protein